VRGAAREGREACLGLTSVDGAIGAQELETVTPIKMPSFGAHLHSVAIPTPLSVTAVPRSRCLFARQSYKGQISTQYSSQPGCIACTASAALTEETLSNGSRFEQMRGPAQEACAAGHLSQDGTAFLEEHRIRGYEVGPDQQTTIVTMANLLQVRTLICP
jgi:hypothetical protein